jgi:hypothetical protein
MERDDILKIIETINSISCNFKKNYKIILGKIYFYDYDLKDHLIRKYEKESNRNTIADFYVRLDIGNKYRFCNAFKEYNYKDIEIGLNFINHLYSDLGIEGISNVLDIPIDTLKGKYEFKETNETSYEDVIKNLDIEDQLKLYYEFYNFIDTYKSVYGIPYNIAYKY